VAIKKELEYEPEQGLVRYLDAEDPSKSELHVPLDKEALSIAKKTVAETAKSIRDRIFLSGPRSAPRNPSNKVRCAECDFGEFCGMDAARKYRGSCEKSFR
jgi:DNA helicase-2/ATP-dependent DNA helicase PcrA